MVKLQEDTEGAENTQVSGRARYYIKKDGKELECAARKDEQMPDGMVPSQAFPCVDQGTQRVAQAAGCQQDQSSGIEISNQRLDGEQHHPAHTQIERQRPALHAFAASKFCIHTKYSYCPHHTKQGPAPWALQCDQGKGCVGACDEQENGGVIEFLQQRFGSLVGDAVIQGGSCINKYQCAAIDGGAGDVPDTTVKRRKGDKQNQGSDAQGDANAVGDGVHDFLADTVFGYPGLIVHAVVFSRLVHVSSTLSTLN